MLGLIDSLGEEAVRTWGRELSGHCWERRQDHEMSESLERICCPVSSAQLLASASSTIVIEFADGPHTPHLLQSSLDKQTGTCRTSPVILLDSIKTIHQKY